MVTQFVNHHQNADDERERENRCDHATLSL